MPCRSPSGNRRAIRTRCQTAPARPSERSGQWHRKRGPPRRRQVNRKPRSLDGAAEAKLVAIACSRPPEGRSHWTMQRLADRLVELEIVDSISDETVRKTLKKTTSSRG